VFVRDSSSVAFWLVSLISSSGFALAMDKVSWVVLQFSSKLVLTNSSPHFCLVIRIYNHFTLVHLKTT
jgi:hypothetical protein